MSHGVSSAGSEVLSALYDAKRGKRNEAIELRCRARVSLNSSVRGAASVRPSTTIIEHLDLSPRSLGFCDPSLTRQESGGKLVCGAPGTHDRSFAKMSNMSAWIAA